MPIVSSETIQELTDTLRDGNHQEKLECLRTTAFNPPDDVTGMPTIAGMQGTPNEIKAAWNDPLSANFEKSKMTVEAEMVSYLRLCASVNKTEKYGSVTFQTIMSNRRTAGDAQNGFNIPAWFLPWRQAGALVKLKITDIANNNGTIVIGNNQHVSNPGLFFTAALSGCSVIVVGNPRNPSIYHGGSALPVTAQLQGRETTEEFWLRKSGRKGTTAKPLGSIGKTDYVSELKSGILV